MPDNSVREEDSKLSTGGSPLSQGSVIPVISKIDKDEVSQIVTYWKENFGITLNREWVSKHLETLRRWEAQWRIIQAKPERRDADGS